MCVYCVFFIYEYVGCVHFKCLCITHEDVCYVCIAYAWCVLRVCCVCLCVWLWWGNPILLMFCTLKPCSAPVWCTWVLRWCECVNVVCVRGIVLVSSCCLFSRKAVTWTVCLTLRKVSALSSSLNLWTPSSDRFTTSLWRLQMGLI